ncbi:MAG TPA: HIT domain-containing protein [Mycobacteriales bacterium]|nr:HIT domain-containing protein [Mycobacteriales bacterium]
MADCTFCRIVAGEGAAARVVEEDDAVAFLDARPLFLGHTLLVPRVHVQTLPDLPAELVAAFFTCARRLTVAVQSGTGADGSLVLVNNVVSQSVPHLHLHVIPRNRGDGLRFWLGPRRRYADEAHAARVAAAIRAAYEQGGAAYEHG